MYHKWFDELSRLIEWYLYTESDGYPLKLRNLVFWIGIVWHRLSANEIVRCFKFKKLNYMRYQFDFLLPLRLPKMSYYFGLCRKILLTNQFSGFSTFDLFDLLILIPGVHCYIVLVIIVVEVIIKTVSFEMVDMLKSLKSSFFWFSNHQTNINKLNMWKSKNNFIRPI